jgi:hypothetical protein
MRNKIEVLRAICFSKEDLSNIRNLRDSFSEIEIDFMIEFKKIYELGTKQLAIFINKLDEDGNKLEPWDIEYYVKQIINGPLGNIARKLAEDKKYFTSIPDILGVMGNNQVTRHNTSMYLDDTIPLECSVDLYNKSPEFIQKLILQSVKNVESVFRSSVGASIINDNTLPIANKAPQLRYDEEPKGEWSVRSHGSYMTKDVFYRIKMNDTRSLIFEKIKNFLQEEHFRIYEDKKKYNPFSSETNTSSSQIFTVEKYIKDGDKEQLIDFDIMGDPFDNRTSGLKIETPTAIKEYTLNTNQGQLNS